MKVGHRQQIGQPRFQPLGLGQRLALGTVAIATRVVRDALPTTGVTPVEMTAEHAGAARFNSAHHAPLLWRQRMRGAKRGPMLAADVGHLQRWPRHQWGASLSTWARSSSGLGVARTVCVET